MRKNYKQHIRNVHPKKDPDDLTPLGQSRLTSFFTQAVPAKVVKDMASEGGDTGDRLDLVNDVVENIVDVGDLSIEKRKHEEIVDVRDDLSRDKRRHESSESTDSGIAETAETSSGPKKVKKDINLEENQVTNNHLDKKLDAIMKGVQELKDAKIFKPPVPAKPDIPDLQTDSHLSWIKHCRSLEELLGSLMMKVLLAVQCVEIKRVVEAFITQLPVELSLERMNICQRSFQA